MKKKEKNIHTRLEYPSKFHFNIYYIRFQNIKFIINKVQGFPQYIQYMRDRETNNQNKKKQFLVNVLTQNTVYVLLCR